MNGRDREAAPKSATSRWKKLAFAAIQVACVAGIAWVIYERRADLVLAFNLDVFDAVMLFALCAAAAPIRAVEFRTATRTLGVPLSFPESVALTQAATLLNLLPMQAGTVLRARVMKARSLTYARYLAIMSCLVLLSIAAAAGVALVALLASEAIPHATRSIAGATLGAIVLGAVGVFLLPLQRIPTGQGWFWQRIHDAASGWQQIKANRRALFILSATTAATPLLLGLRFWICFSALSMEVPLIDSVLLGAALLVAVPVSITPGSIGVRELVGSALGAGAGLSFPAVLAAVTLDRVISLLFSVVAGGGSLGWLRRRMLRGDWRSDTATQAIPGEHS